MSQQEQEKNNSVVDFFDDESPEGWESPFEDDDVDIFNEPTEEDEVEEVEQEEVKTGGVEEPVQQKNETPTDELEILRQQNAALLERFNKMMEPKEEKQQQETPTPQVQQQAPAKSGDVYDFIGDEDIDDIVADKAKFNAVISKAVNFAVSNVVENIQRAMPQVVKQHVTTQTEINKAVAAFYEDNADLAPVKKVVGAVANEVAAEHPEWELTKIFEETATRTRTMLGLRKGVASSPSVDNKTPANPAAKPALPGLQKGGVRGSSKILEGQAKHIMDVL